MARSISPDDSFPFRPGETLKYKISWGPFTVGSAELKVHEEGSREGEASWHISLTARTNGFADALFRVRNEVHSWVSDDFQRVLHYTKRQIEGDTDKDIVVSFDWLATGSDDGGVDTPSNAPPESRLVSQVLADVSDEVRSDEGVSGSGQLEAVGEAETLPVIGVARYSNYGKVNDPVELPGFVHDPLSIVFFARIASPTEGEPSEVLMSDGKKTLSATLHWSGQKELRLPIGEIGAFRVRPEMEGIGGVFKKSDGATIDVWFSDDAYRLPVRMESAVIVGSFHADLVSVEGPGLEEWKRNSVTEVERSIPRGGRHHRR